MCIDNNKLKLFSLGNVFMSCLEPTEFQKTFIWYDQYLAYASFLSHLLDD